MDPAEFAAMIARTVVQMTHNSPAKMYQVVRQGADDIKREETTSLPQIMASQTDQSKILAEQIGELVTSVDDLAKEIKGLRRLLKKKVDDDEDEDT